MQFYSKLRSNMQSLIFFSRVAFICNVCFVLVWIMRFYPILKTGQPGEMVSLVLILGVLIAFLLNLVVNGFMLALILQRKPVLKHFPRWLIITNFLFLFPQIILFIK
jgi:RsiW-degrading membrane proteinase PrsW (M82 family)